MFARNALYGSLLLLAGCAFFGTHEGYEEDVGLVTEDGEGMPMPDEDPFDDDDTADDDDTGDDDDTADDDDSASL